MAERPKNRRKTLNVLEVSASARLTDSVTRRLTGDLVDALEIRHGNMRLTRRDLSDGIPQLDHAWIDANFTPDEERTVVQRQTLALSDELVAELRQADVVVIGVPVYNFGVPASLKAWIDLIARARVTFRYTENGPEGLLKGKKAYLVVSSGGVPVDAPYDYATPYLRHALRFVGITDIEVIAADRVNVRGDDAIDSARESIARLIHEAPAESRAA